MLDVPLSITTAPKGPYDDAFNSKSGLLQYRYRGTDPMHRDKEGLGRALTDNIPLIYFFGLIPGRYLATWPVYIVGADHAALTFTVAVDDMAFVAPDASIVASGSEDRRAYITTVTKRRLHQRSFRERVLLAYRRQCSVCRIRHHELLDAAHIIPDVEPEGLPHVRNGISLCKLHHAAYDAMMIGITPDYRLHVRHDLLEEIDGPMLQHGIKELHDQRIILPHSRDAWPDREKLEYRYERFTAR
jgi:putative restriction endonuclease